jgi:hypothetical protein
VAFRFRTAADKVAVEFAPQTPDRLEVLVDGKPARVLSRAAGRLEIGLTPFRMDHISISPEEPLSHTLELRYRYSVRGALVTRHTITPPQLIGTSGLSEVYWHVVLPGDRHVIRSPSQLTAASEWQWLGSFWGKRPVRTQEALEEWVRASSQLSPTITCNEYLFTELAPLSTIELISAPRWLIVLVSSTVLLAIVLALIHWPRMRQRWVLVALTCVLAGIALVFPGPVLMIAQASVLGVVLSALAMLIARWTVRPAPWRLVMPASSSPRPLAARSDSAIKPALTAGSSTSPTVTQRMSNLP